MLMIANTDVLRQQSRALVLSVLRRERTASHTEITQKTRLSSATVSAITNDLALEGIIKRLDPVRRAGRGRPRVMFKLHDDAAYVAIIRITSDLVEYSLVNYSGTLKDRFSEARPFPNDTVKAFVSRLNKGLDKMVDRAELNADHIKTISITSKGVVSPGPPVLLWSPVFGDQQIDFGSALNADRNAHIQLANETRFAAQAYMKRSTSLPLSNPRKIGVLSLGNSIGMGICTEYASGRMESAAPAFSHMVHQLDGPLCRCGERGCIEAYSAFYGILRSALDAPERGLPTSHVPLATLDEIANSARAGNLHAELAFRRAAEALGVGLSRMLSLFGEMPIVVTGPGIRYLDLMLATIEKHMNQNLYLRQQGTFPIAIEENEAGLVYDGHLGNCLDHLDRNVLAPGATSGNRVEP